MFFLMLFNYLITPPFPYPSPPPTFNPFPSPLSLSMGPLYMFLKDPSSSFPHYPPFPSPLVTVSFFFISMSLVVFHSLVCFGDYISLVNEIICFLSFITWLISLSIILSSFIHAVSKGRSSFFLLCSVPSYKCTTVF